VCLCRETVDELSIVRSQSARQQADSEYLRCSLEAQKNQLEEEVRRAQLELASLQSTVTHMCSSQASMQAELSATKVLS